MYSFVFSLNEHYVAPVMLYRIKCQVLHGEMNRYNNMSLISNNFTNIILTMENLNTQEQVFTVSYAFGIWECASHRCKQKICASIFSLLVWYRGHAVLYNYAKPVSLV